MSELISGKEALIALANGKAIQFQVNDNGEWLPLDTSRFVIDCVLEEYDGSDESYKFRLKPRTIMIGDVEVAAPFEPKEGEDCRCYYVNTTFKDGFDWYHSSHHKDGRIVWRNMEEIKQVVAALRKLFKGE